MRRPARERCTARRAGSKRGDVDSANRFPSPYLDARPAASDEDSTHLRILLVIGLALIAISAGALAISSQRSNSDSRSLPAATSTPSFSPSPSPERVSAQIKITVTGNYVSKLNVTWTDADGRHTTVVNNPSYWTKEVPVVSSGTTVELSAVTQSNFAIGVTPRCEITGAFGGQRFALGKPEYKHGHWQCHAVPSRSAPPRSTAFAVVMSDSL